MAAGSLDEKAGTEIEIRRHEYAAATQLSEVEKSVEALDANPDDVQLTSAEEQSDVKQAGLIRPRHSPRSRQSSIGSSAQTRTMKIDLATIDGSGDTDITLQDGDVVRVETRDPHPISVIGLVQKPGQYEMPVGQPVHVLDAIAMAGERSNPWADKIYITRHVTGENEPVVIETSVVNAQHSNESNIRLSPGDVVSVEQTPQTVVHNIFSNIVRFSIVAGRSVPLF